MTKIEEEMREWYVIKIRAKIGGGVGESNEATLLNRILRRFPDRFEYEADPKHVQEIIKGLHLKEGSKGLDWAARKASESEVSEAVPLEASQAAKYRSLTARANFLALDRADIQFAVKELCREMSMPTTLSWCRLKQLGRY